MSIMSRKKNNKAKQSHNGASPVKHQGTNTGTKAHKGHTHKPYGSCHTGPTHVFNIGKLRVHGASERQITGDWRWNAMLRLNAGDSFDWQTKRYGLDFPSPLVKLNDKAKAFAPTLEVYNEPMLIDVDWPDLSAPPLTKVWWDNLYGTLQKIGEETTDIVVHCMGGHGRTGTALTILAIMAGAVPENDDPVAWLRAHYCVEAVETKEQIAYITKITGKTITEEPARSAYGGSYLNYGPTYSTTGATGTITEAQYTKVHQENLGKAPNEASNTVYINTMVAYVSGVRWERETANGAWYKSEGAVQSNPPLSEASEVQVGGKTWTKVDGVWSVKDTPKNGVDPEPIEYVCYDTDTNEQVACPDEDDICVDPVTQVEYHCTDRDKQSLCWDGHLGVYTQCLDWEVEAIDDARHDDQSHDGPEHHKPVDPKL